MYGLLCESLHDFIKESYGDDVWKLVRERADVRLHSFVTHQVYSESVIPRIAKAASGVTGTPYNELMNSWGVYFLGFVGKYGYDRILKLRQMGKQFYDTDIHVEVLSEQLVGDYSHVTMRLNFDNSAYRYIQKEDEEEQEILPITSDFFFEVFPFNIVFRQDMVVHNVGSGLATVFPDLDGKKINDAFLLARPLVEFTWNMIISHPNNLFEIMSKEPVKRERNLHNRVQNSDYENANRSADVDVELMAFQSIIGDDYKDGNSANAMESWGDGSRCLKLKGQMRYMPEWESIIFLGTPVMESLSAMFKTGLYINDLSMHDSSRDLVLAGTQQSEELKRALIQEQKKSSKLEESMKMLDYEMKKTDDLLYRMIPKPVAKRLRKGEPAVNTCEVFPDVTILFSDVVGFTRICSHITPMQVVSMLNTMYTLFDTLSEKHRVFKVETIGDAYMVVAGAPEKTKYHAHNICDMALDMVRSIDHLKDPSNGNNIQIRVGIHSGMVVAGVVGHKMPRYGLHGDTVHTASAMESNGKEMHIQLSSATYEHLKGSHFIFERRGTITIKGNVEIETYWLKGKRDKDGNAQAACPQFEAQTISKAAISASEPPIDEEELITFRDTNDNIRGTTDVTFGATSPSSSHQRAITTISAPEAVVPSENAHLKEASPVSKKKPMRVHFCIPGIEELEAKKAKKPASTCIPSSHQKFMTKIFDNLLSNPVKFTQLVNDTMEANMSQKNRVAEPNTPPASEENPVHASICIFPIEEKKTNKSASSSSSHQQTMDIIFGDRVSEYLMSDELKSDELMKGDVAKKTALTTSHQQIMEIDFSDLESDRLMSGQPENDDTMIKIILPNTTPSDEEAEASTAPVSEAKLTGIPSIKAEKEEEAMIANQPASPSSYQQTMKKPGRVYFCIRSMEKDDGDEAKNTDNPASTSQPSSQQETLTIFFVNLPADPLMPGHSTKNKAPKGRIRLKTAASLKWDTPTQPRHH
ncbi:Soluble guanylate cyclase 88E [Bagarius yarrelli]|uniref:guanylate cyclase n=1 Tax=Bagarius yarrelli TaxID=175774 RepID=A0A556UZR0_BAGYA|nr:Soluble guanylate cyclase 88E [Bagarius yarrelli]